jgi:hypothetical protein
MPPTHVRVFFFFPDWELGSLGFFPADEEKGKKERLSPWPDPSPTLTSCLPQLLPPSPAATSSSPSEPPCVTSLFSSLRNKQTCRAFPTMPCPWPVFGQGFRCSNQSLAYWDHLFLPIFLIPCELVLSALPLTFPTEYKAI